MDLCSFRPSLQRYADMAKKLAEKKREEFNALPAQVQKDLVSLSRREKKEVDDVRHSLSISSVCQC